MRRWSWVLIVWMFCALGWYNAVSLSENADSFTWFMGAWGAIWTLGLIAAIITLIALRSGTKE